MKERLPPDVSFTQDTEVSESFNSSIQDSQPPVQVTPKPSKILPTPTKVFPAPTKQKDRSLFLDADADELQLRSPRHSMSEPDISENVKTRVRRSRRKSGFETTMQPPQTPRKAPTEPSPSKSAKKKEKSALEALKKALVLVEQADMTEAEMASAEDAMFDAFTKMRDKKRRVSGIK